MNFLKRWLTAVIIITLGFGVTVATVSFVNTQRETHRVAAVQTVQAAETKKVEALVQVECERSLKQARLREKLIDDLTLHVATPVKGSPSGLFLTVKLRNKQLDHERAELLGLGSKIPAVIC